MFRMHQIETPSMTAARIAQEQAQAAYEQQLAAQQQAVPQGFGTVYVMDAESRKAYYNQE